MNELLAANWPIILVGAVVVLILLWLMLRPRQRVTLSSETPVRPHMAVAAKSGEGRGITDEAAAAASDVAGPIIGTRVHEELPGAKGPPDDLVKLKGVGPKFAAMLNERGITRFDQVAKLSEGQLEAIDASLGAFKGRFQRDRIVEQADYLSRGDVDGFEQTFGKL